MLAQNEYDALGQLIQKNVGNEEAKPLQEVKYKYNVRGWLKQINDPRNLGNSLFAFGLSYNDPSCGGTPLYNGNISQSFWRTGNKDDNLKSYTYQYDALNRIKSGIDNTGRYNLASISYDKNGNILSLDRTGHLDDAGTVFGEMDKLTYKYNTGNKLLAVTDTGDPTQGFKDGDNIGTYDYAYDANGNMTLDKNKKITNITYNHLNLPTKISFTFTDDPDSLSEGSIDFVYDAVGIKVSKHVSKKGLQKTYVDKNTFYGGNFIYKGAANAKELVFFNHAEGYVEPKDGDFAYIYQYKDHLGNIRLAYSDENKNGTITPDEIKEENNYYPFGLKQEGYNELVRGNEHKDKRYNGIKLDDDLGLNLYSAKFRGLDSETGRWWQIDPKAEKFYDQNPYNSNFNNPIMNKDPDGDNPLLGALIGAGTDILFQAIEIGLSDEKTYDNSFSWGSVAVSGASGAIGIGLATKFKKAAKLTKLLVEVGTDAGASVGTQLVKDGKVDIKKVGIDIASGQTLGKVAGNLTKNRAINSKKGQKLQNNLNKQKNIAQGKHHGKKGVKKSNADVKGAQKKFDNHVETGTARGTAPTSGAVSTFFDTYIFKSDNNENKK